MTTTPTPACDCGKPLQEVKQGPNSMLNSEQFDAAKVGDWFCEGCTNRPGVEYRYFWNRDLPRAVVPSPARSDKDAEPIYFVRYAGQDGWKEATEEAYWLFSEGSRRILYAAKAQESAPSSDHITYAHEVDGPWRLELNGVTISRHDKRAELWQAIADLRAALARRATAGNAAPTELPPLPGYTLEKVSADRTATGYTIATYKDEQVRQYGVDCYNVGRLVASNTATAAPGDLPPLARFDFRDIDGDFENFVQVEDGNYVLFHEVEKLIASNAGAAAK